MSILNDENEGLIPKRDAVSRSVQSQPKERTRVDIALGNMRTHLYLDREKPVWTSVDRGDLEVILDYVNIMRLAPAQALEEFANSLVSIDDEAMDAHTLQEIAFKARSKAARLRYELKRNER